MIEHFKVNNLKELDLVANKIINLTKNHRKFAFFAEMGVGKTTLIKSMSNLLGVKDLVNSPTFSIVNEYLINNNQKIYHFDLYRIKNEMELLDIGYEDYLLGKNYCFIEWPEIGAKFIDENFVTIHMRMLENKRYIDVKF
tara:strand:- start:190 stop:609 length:420 start_codon:yes stop_codon:yes gene_type:complete